MAMQRSMMMGSDAWDEDSPSRMRMQWNLWCNQKLDLKMGFAKMRTWSQRSLLFWVPPYAAYGVHKTSLCNTKASAEWGGGCFWAEQQYLWLVCWMPPSNSASAVGDPNVVKLSSWCPVFSLTLLGCSTKPLLTPMPAQHWRLQEGAGGTEASYLSCSHKYERWGFQTPKGNWRNILFPSEEFPSVRYEVSFCSGHYQVRGLNTLLLKTFMPAL